MTRYATEGRDVSQLPEPVPKSEPQPLWQPGYLHVWGKTYRVLPAPKATAEGLAYMVRNLRRILRYRFTAAHRSLPPPTYARGTIWITARFGSANQRSRPLP